MVIFTLISTLISTTGDPLQPYREKRDFDKTPEPTGEGSTAEGRIFVVQKHSARNLHYDFRLEAGGVLKSWAVPKGPSTDPKVKRLMIETEDHPISYAHFEGVIPEGQYGAGTVLVWDTGTYRNTTEDDGKEVPIEEALDRGHASVQLEGRKLKGGFALTRTGRGWLLVKKRDEMAGSSDILEEKPSSALTGRSLEDVAASGDELGAASGGRA